MICDLVERTISPFKDFKAHNKCRSIIMDVDAYTILYLAPVFLLGAYIISLLWGDSEG